MRVDELSKAIKKELTDYLETSTDIVRNTVDEVVEEGVTKLKNTSPKKSGRYSRRWKSKTTTDSPTGKTSTIHNTKGQLTHLLEKGYAKVNGGRVVGRPHIAPVEAELMEKFEKTLKETFYIKSQEEILKNKKHPHCDKLECKLLNRLEDTLVILLLFVKKLNFRHAKNLALEQV